MSKSTESTTAEAVANEATTSSMQHTPTLLQSYLKTLRVPTMWREASTVARQISEHDGSYELYLQQLAELEVQQRKAGAIARRLKQAQFPVNKEVGDFDFSAVPKLNKKRMVDLAQCNFINLRSNIIFNGPPGTGKTHLAIALGREACRRGYKAKFFTASGLANLYREAREERQILKLEKQIQKLDLIIMDELGYIPLDRQGAEHLFGFFSQCYEQVSLVVTTNLPFADWPQIFANDQRMTGALLDRLTHHVHIIAIEGDSFRLKANTKNKKPAVTKPTKKTPADIDKNNQTKKGANPPSK
jgi:DNA replication protein DnaC